MIRTPASLKWISLALVILGLYTLYRVNSEPYINNTYKNNGKPYYYEAKQNLIVCTAAFANVYYKNSTKFFEKFAECIHKYIPISNARLDMFLNDFYGEKKAFVPLNKNYDQSKCKWLTVGIGGSSTAENIFKQMYPECQLYGVEPGDSGNFSKIGTVMAYGIGPDDTKTEIVVCENNHYKKKNITVLSLTTFMDKYIGSRLMHYLTIDIEGLEYSVLETLIGEGKSAKDGVKFCQIDAELHNPKAPNANSIIKDLNPVAFISYFVNEKSPYIPIFNVPYRPHPHQKVTFINVEDEECEKAFHYSAYFNK